MDKKNREGFLQVSDYHFVKRTTFDYFTEKDLIKRLSIKHNLSYGEAEDLYLRLIEYIKDKLEKPNNNYELGFYIPMFANFRKKVLKIEDLLTNRESVSFKRAKILLDRYCAKKRSEIGIK